MKQIKINSLKDLNIIQVLNLRTAVEQAYETNPYLTLTVYTDNDEMFTNLQSFGEEVNRVLCPNCWLQAITKLNQGE